MAAGELTPKIRSYDDYRLFLADYGKLRKQKNPKWSYSVWAKKLGLRNKSPLLMVLNRHRNASASLTKKLVDYFKFSPVDESYFRVLVLNSDQNKQIHVHELGKKRELATEVTPRVQLTSDQQDKITSWLSFVVKEAASLSSATDFTQKMNTALIGPYSEVEISNALAALLQTGLLFSEAGQSALRLSESPPDLDWNSDRVRRLHFESLEASKRAFETLSPAERAFRLSFIRMKKERVPEAVIMLRRFQKDFTQLFEQDDGNEIFELNLHLFAVTNGLAEKI